MKIKLNKKIKNSDNEIDVKLGYFAGAVLLSQLIIVAVVWAFTLAIVAGAYIGTIIGAF